MSTHSTHHESSKNPNPGNGGLKTETTIPSAPIERVYVLEDFSQQAINTGQQEINFLLTVVNAKVIKALEQITDALEALSNGGSIDWGALQAALTSVRNANQNVAGPFPPGCIVGGTSGGTKK